jgi:hypothetical protein
MTFEDIMINVYLVGDKFVDIEESSMDAGMFQSGKTIEL